MEYKKKITELANGSILYEYPDGIKVIYARDKEDIDTDIEISFEGGSMVQGHIMGLAHFVEHTMFLSQKLNKNFSFTNGITSRKQTVYQMSVNGNRIKKEVNDELKSRGLVLEKKNRGELLTKLLKVKDDVFDLLKTFAKRVRLQKLIEKVHFKSKKEKIRGIRHQLFRDKNNREIKYCLNTFFDEVDNTQFDMSKFENEKKIIDAEFNCVTSVNSYGAFKSFLKDTSRIVNCGKMSTLKHVTFEDVAEYKKKYYTKENMLIRVESPLSYEDIEESIIKTVSSRVQSSQKAQIPQKSNFPKESSYYVNEQSDSIVDGTVNVNFSIANDNKKMGKIERIVGSILFQCAISNSDIYEYMRKDRSLLYSIGHNSSNSETMNDYSDISMQFDTNNQNINKVLRNMSQFVYDAVSGASDELFYKIKTKEMKNKIYSKNFKQKSQMMLDGLVTDEQFRDFAYVLDHAKISDLRACLKEFVETSTLSITLSKDVKQENLPDINFLEGIVKGTEKSTDLEKIKQGNKKEPIILDFIKGKHEDKNSSKALMVI